MSFAELSRFKNKNNERIPKYADAARLCLELGLWANVEIKPAKGHERPTGEAVSRLTKELWKGAPLGPLLSSFSIEALEAAQATAPELPRGYLVDEIPDGWRGTLKRLECVALHCNYKHLTESLAAQVHATGCSILLWTVNEPVDAKRLFRMGADCLVTDALDRIGPDFS